MEIRSEARERKDWLCHSGCIPLVTLASSGPSSFFLFFFLFVFFSFFFSLVLPQDAIRFKGGKRGKKPCDDDATSHEHGPCPRKKTKNPK